MDINKIKSEVKYLLFDLDGTVASDERCLAKDNHLIPDLLKSLNLKHSIITGRPVYMMRREIDALKPTMPVVGANGAMILDSSGNEMIWSHVMNQDYAKQFMKYLIETKTNFYLYTFKQIYTYPDEFEHVTRWREIIKTLDPKFQWKISSISEYDPDKEPILKFLISSSEHQRICDYVKSHYSDEFSTALSSRTSIDIGDIRVSKGTGLQEIMKVVKATPEQFMVFGDGGNDIPMFKIAKYSVALSNAEDFVKEAATFVTDIDNNGSGVYHFIKKIWQ